MGCEHECFNEHRIEELENSLRQMQERQSDRHKEFYERIGELERKTALSENDLNHIKSTVDEMNNNIKTLMAVPESVTIQSLYVLLHLLSAQLSVLC